MKDYLLIGLVLLIMFLFYYLNKSSDADLKAIKPINTVTLVEDISSVNTQDIDQKNTQKIVEPNLVIDEAEDIQQAIDSTMAKSAYMQLFDDYLLAKTCESLTRNYGYNFHKDKSDDRNHSDVLIDKLGVENTTSFQIDSWNRLFNDCIALFDHHSFLVRQLNDKYYSNDDEIWDIRRLLSELIYDELLSKKTKTNEEKSLKKVLTLITPYKEMMDSTYLNRFIKSSLSDEELNSINQQLESLNEQFRNTSESNEQDLAEIESQIHQLIQYLESNEIPDSKTFNDNKSQFINLHNRLIAMLPNTSGHEFKLILQGITSGLGAFDEFEKPSIRLDDEMPVLVNLNHQIYQRNNIKDPKYYNILIYPAMDLFYCYKGVDCSVDSLIVANFCFGLYGRSRYPEACESDLENFYFNHYLSSNQLIDVNQLFNYLVTHYAQ